MRVKIAYTVEVEEVPKEVAEIMTRATNDLDEAYQEAVSYTHLTLPTILRV